MKKTEQRTESEHDTDEFWRTIVPGMMRSMKKDMDNRCIADIERYGLSRMHLNYLIALCMGKVTMKSLSECLSMDKAHTTRAIADLRAKGLVTDDREKENSRKYNVFLTKEGEELRESIKKTLDQAIKEYTVGISPDEMKVLKEIILKIRDNIDSGDTSKECIGCCKR